MEHICIKPGCGKQYQDSDPDPYYCPGCKKAKAEIARRVDEQVAARPKKERLSELKQLERDGHISVPGGRITIRTINNGG